MKSFKSYLEEGVNDPAIFKAVFTAGGPGSGKSFTADKTGLVHMGFRFINSDDAFERMLDKAGLDKKNPKHVFSDKGQEIRRSAVTLTGKKMQMAVNQRLGLVIDGTGKDFNKIKKQVIALRKIGYECAMIFVNTDVDTAIQRDNERPRSLGPKMVTKMWKEVQRNIGKFQTLFKNNMYIVDNSSGTNINKATIPVYKKISIWAKKEPRMPQAKAWILPKKK